MNRETIEIPVNKAIDLLVENEPQLLDLNGTERALSHHRARYLGGLLPKYFNVDCEYNRHFDDPKQLNLKRRQAKDGEICAPESVPRHNWSQTRLGQRQFTCA